MHVPKKARAEAQGEGLHPHPAELGYGKVTEFVHQHHDAEHHRELGNNLKKMHTLGRDLGLGLKQQRRALGPIGNNLSRLLARPAYRGTSPER